MKWPEEKTKSARLNNSFENGSISILFRISFTKRRRSASNLESAKIGYFDQKIVVCSSALCTIGFSNQFTTEHGYLHSTREAKDAQWIRTIVVVATDMHIIPKTRFRVQKEGRIFFWYLPIPFFSFTFKRNCIWAQQHVHLSVKNHDHLISSA